MYTSTVVSEGVTQKRKLKICIVFVQLLLYFFVSGGDFALRMAHAS